MAAVMKMDEVGPVSMNIDDTPKVDKEADDLYKKFKVLQKQLEFLDIQEEYIKDEMKVRLLYLFYFLNLYIILSRKKNPKK